MSLEIDGVEYVPGGEILAALGISRQTLWRWRQEGKIPQGHRFRDGRVLFTRQEAERIIQHANRIEPISDQDRRQLGLFGRGR